MDTIDWRINCDCDNNCTYCFANKRVQYSREVDDIILNELIRSNIKNVTITGGEPTANPKRLQYIINKLYEAQKCIYLSTNGYKFSEISSVVIPKISILGIPLDGYNQETNMINGRSASSFNTALSILNNSNGDIIYKIGTVITKKNMSYNWIFEMFNMLKKFKNISIWRIYEVLPEGKGEINSADLCLTNDERNFVENAIKDISAKKHQFKIEFITRKMRSNNYLIIQPDGTAFVPIDHGNYVEEKELGDIKYNSLNLLINAWKNSVANIDISYSELRSNDFLYKGREYL